MVTVQGANSTAADAEVAYWICPPGDVVRHATTVKPGAVPHGQTVTSVAGDEFKIPWPTRFERQSPGAFADARCQACARAVKEKGYVERRWDF